MQDVPFSINNTQGINKAIYKMNVPGKDLWTNESCVIANNVE